jgi:hypothetical protein
MPGADTSRRAKSLALVKCGDLQVRTGGTLRCTKRLPIRATEIDSRRHRLR